MEDVYVVCHLHTALLERLASCKLGLVACLGSVAIDIKPNLPKIIRRFRRSAIAISYKA